MATSKILTLAPQDRERRAALRMTGRYIITYKKEARQTLAAKLAETGFSAAPPIPHGAKAVNALPSGEYISLNNIGVALVDPTHEQHESLHLMAAQEDAVLAMEPERINQTVSRDPSNDYVRGWRDAIEALSGKLLEEGPAAPAVSSVLAAAELGTWGLIATKVINSRFSGANIKLAVLDTGFDLTHPDFAGRPITTKNFVGDHEPFHDGVGHGTHCIGTAAGPLHPTQGVRYGVAYNAQIFAGRVLDDNGRGGDFNILQGIDWAIEQECDIVSLSLGAPWFPGDPPFSQAYETAAQRALASGCLLVVAAGNEASNPQYVGAVGTPGNSPSVLTVAAVDGSLNTAPFSNRLQPDAPGVKGPDCAAPGVDVYSSWPVTHGGYHTISGTSMATPHVAGIAALYAEANPGVRAQDLKDLILAHCETLAGGFEREGEVGRGFVQAPSMAIAAKSVSRRRARSKKATRAGG